MTWTRDFFNELYESIFFNNIKRLELSKKKTAGILPVILQTRKQNVMKRGYTLLLFFFFFFCFYCNSPHPRPCSDKHVTTNLSKKPCFNSLLAEMHEKLERFSTNFIFGKKWTSIDSRQQIEVYRKNVQDLKTVCYSFVQLLGELCAVNVTAW